MPRSNNFRNEYISSEFFIVFRNGYNYNSPSVKCRCVVDIGTGKEKWGAIPEKRYYVLKIIEIIEIRNLRELDTFEKMKDKLIKN